MRSGGIDAVYTDKRYAWYRTVIAVEIDLSNPAVMIAVIGIFVVGSIFGMWWKTVADAPDSDAEYYGINVDAFRLFPAGSQHTLCINYTIQRYVVGNEEGIEQLHLGRNCDALSEYPGLDEKVELQQTSQTGGDQ